MNSQQNASNGQPSDSTIQNQHFHGSHPIDASDVVLYFFAFFFPPFSVYIRRGLCTNDFFLNLLLTAMFGVPGTIHAIYIVYVTSPITGTAERRISRNSDQVDYERIVESDTPRQHPDRQIQDFQNNQQPFCDFGNGAQSNSYNQPPPYEEVHSGGMKLLTDNKIQRS